MKAIVGPFHAGPTLTTVAEIAAPLLQEAADSVLPAPLISSAAG